MRRCPFVLVLVILTVLAGGCAKKQSRTTATAMPASPPPQPVAAPSAPPVATPPPAPAPDPLAGDLASVNRYLREQGLVADLLFDYNRHELRPESRRQLEATARFMNEHPQFAFALEGHADERGTVEYNLALGQKRAVTARSYLDSMGVVHDRIQVTSYGKERPVCSQPHESCWQQNRRVHFEIVRRTE